MSTAPKNQTLNYSSTQDRFSGIEKPMSSTTFPTSAEPSPQASHAVTPSPVTAIPTWTPEQASEHYNIENWGAGFFSVNDKGNMCVHPYGKPGPTIDIMDVVEDIKEKGLKFPCVIRFQDVL